MHGTLVEPLSGYGVVASAVAVTGTAAGLLRAYLAYRTRLHEEREASARNAARLTGLIRLAETDHDVVRIVERDRDGDREVELGLRNALRCDGAGEAA
ncbi:hypothetical protein ACFFWC_05060 [Plantactinospora siamensis]|uniref:Uncharacterized protein n=1 Tax=Plantactinospora siamensis TaxID=555372 RepID=A0ABV6NRR7_9ACTN